MMGGTENLILKQQDGKQITTVVLKTLISHLEIKPL